MDVPTFTFEYGGFSEGESFEVTVALGCEYIKCQDIGKYDINIDVSLMVLGKYNYKVGSLSLKSNGINSNYIFKNMDLCLQNCY